MIPVTKTFLPPQKEYQHILEKVWETGWLTNRGVLVNELEEKLKQFLGVPNMIAMTNGTLPLQIAIKAMGLKGEIITTPFSYVATTSSIVWEGCIPVFVDIHPDYLTIDETQIEAAITAKTTAILVTHVFGNPCAIETIEGIAKKHHLKVIYDGAHCFGVTYKGQSIFNYGDVSTCSFHATKLFHTGEGGALFCKPGYYEIMYSHHNFGHDGPEAFQGLGINAKMSEPQAAMGLAVLPFMHNILDERKRLAEWYNEGFQERPLKLLQIREGTIWNYSYYPVIFKDENQLLKIQKALNASNIFPRRYFYPSLNSISYINGKSMPISEHIAPRIMCLPLYLGLSDKELYLIIDIINKSLC